MRNLKKFLALVLAMLMLLSVAVISTSAADADIADYQSAATHLQGLKILKGDEKGNLMLENGVTRWQAALFFVQALTGKTEAATWNADKTSAIFSDVPEYGTAIDYAYGIKLILGRGNGVYGYADPITYQDMLVMAVRALGYETADMQYPYGYILAAQKLGLTEVVEDNQVNFKAALNRGETAQIIWNMLGTEIAGVDTLNNDKILYPGEPSMLDRIQDKECTEAHRPTLLEEAGYASGEFFVQIVDLIEAADDDDVDTVAVKGTYNDEKGVVAGSIDMEIAAADLGIDFETARKADYLGKYMTILVDCAAKDFDTSYNINADESDAAVVIATMQETTTVNNVAATAIKYDAEKGILTLGAEKFNTEKYTIEGIDPKDFTYTTKDGYTEDGDRYIVADYFVKETKTVEKINGKDEVTTEKKVIVTVTPVTLVQYVERTIKSNETGKNETFVLVGHIDTKKHTNIEGDESYIGEYLLADKAGFKGTEITENTKGVSKNPGKLSLNVTVEGEDVKSGDFVFAAFNAEDNVLTIVKNIGTLKTGRLTAQQPSKETVKIGGATYGFGFAGDKDALTPYDQPTVAKYIEDLESGKDNVEYLLADGKIVYLAACDSKSSSTSNYPFVIMDIDSTTGRPNVKRIADILDKKVSAIESDLADGWYIVNGAVAVPVMDTKTGDWKIAYIGGVADPATYDAEEDEFDSIYAIASLANTLETIGSISAKNQEKYDVIEAVVKTGPIFALVDEADDVYTITNKKDLVVSNDMTTGLTFSDNNAKTNNITADPDVDAARVTLNKDTVIIALDANGNIMSRTGVQVAKYSLKGNVTYYSANADLIVVYTAENLANTEALGRKWESGKSVATDATYYLTLDADGAEYEANDDDTFTFTFYNVFDLAAMEVVDKISMTVDEDDVKAARDNLLKLGANALLVVENGEIAAAKISVAEALELLNEDYAAIDLANVKFENADTLYGILGLEDDKALADIDITVVTVNMTEDVDLDDLLLNDKMSNYVDDDGNIIYDGPVEGQLDKLTYDLSVEVVEEIAEPTEGVLDQYIIDTIGKKVLAHGEDQDFEDDDVDLYDVTIEFYAVAKFDEKAEVLSMIVYKVITAVEQ